MLEFESYFSKPTVGIGSDCFESLIISVSRSGFRSPGAEANFTVELDPVPEVECNV